MKNEVTYDKDCRFGGGRKKVEGGTYPFPNEDGSEFLEVDCVHCQRLAVLTEQIGNRHHGVIAMCSGRAGLVACYSADELREMAKQLQRMADYLDRENAEAAA